jgi:hypothetical protein
MAEISPLRRRMLEDMTVRNLSPATQQSYVYAVAKFSRHFGARPTAWDQRMCVPTSCCRWRREPGQRRRIFVVDVIVGGLEVANLATLDRLAAGGGVAAVAARVRC